jgi:hypothetical protein
VKRSIPIPESPIARTDLLNIVFDGFMASNRKNYRISFLLPLLDAARVVVCRLVSFWIATLSSPTVHTLSTASSTGPDLLGAVREMKK